MVNGWGGTTGAIGATTGATGVTGAAKKPVFELGTLFTSMPSLAAVASSRVAMPVGAAEVIQVMASIRHGAAFEAAVRLNSPLTKSLRAESLDPSEHR
jgi:hypothetical protein